MSDNPSKPRLGRNSPYFGALGYGFSISCVLIYNNNVRRKLCLLLTRGATQTRSATQVVDHSLPAYNMARSHLISATRRAVKESPREIFNLYLFFCNAIVSFSGVAKGFDEGKQAGRWRRRERR